MFLIIAALKLVAKYQHFDFFVQDQADPMSGMSLLAGKALSSARMSDILSQTSLTGSQQLHQREQSGQ